MPAHTHAKNPKTRRLHRPPRRAARYAYSRDCDGCDDVFDVWDFTAGRVVTSVHFWASVDGEEALAEGEARRVVRELEILGPRHVRAFDDVS